jgi:acetyltransferase-like isoleucine patch superfamily enzyme
VEASEVNYYTSPFNLTENHDGIVGVNCRFYPPFNIYDAQFGDDCIVGPFCEIQRGVTIGNRVKIGSHSFLCRGVYVKDEAFIGHGVMFTNDKYPRGTNEDGSLKTEDDWECQETLVGFRSTVGTGAIILPGADVGDFAVVGAGAVVTKPVLPYEIVAGNPARVIGHADERWGGINPLSG